jgi:hypothetical protein
MAVFANRRSFVAHRVSRSMADDCWVRRFKTGGLEALQDRSSRPKSMPTRTSAEIKAAVIAARREHRRGQDWLGPEFGTCNGPLVMGSVADER